MIILSRITEPSIGLISIKGRLASFLEPTFRTFWTPLDIISESGTLELMLARNVLQSSVRPEPRQHVFAHRQANPESARQQALQGREYVIREWNSHKAFKDLAEHLESVARRSNES